MKQKGLIILVTMLAVVFLASTVYAGGGSWYQKCVKKVWSYVHKVEKKVDKNTWQIKKLKYKHKKHKYTKKKRWVKPRPKPRVDMEALKKAIIDELMATPTFLAAVTGEDGKDGADGMDGVDGKEGPPGPASTVISRWEAYSGLQMEEAKFPGAHILQSQFIGTQLVEANLKGATLNDSSFGGANFTDANLEKAVVVNTDFSGADFTRANLKGTDLRTALSCAGAIWDNTTCPDGTNSSANGGDCMGDHMIPAP